MLEILYALIYLKPVLEVLRIVKGEEKRPYETLSLLDENSRAKSAEVFAQAGPAAFLQLYVLHLAAHPSYFQYLSIMISIATAAFTIASMGFNLDTDPGLRVTDPFFYGLVPDSSLARTKIFAAMFINSFFQMAAVVLGTASLAHFDVKIAASAWCSRLAMVYAIKLTRQDFAYFVPIRGLPGVLIAAFINRPCTMCISDIGLNPYARHPYEMGCAQWWFGRVWPWLLLVSTIVLRSVAPAEMGSTVLNTTAAMAELLGANASVNLDANSNATAAVVNETLSARVFIGDYAQSVLTNPAVLSAVSAMLFVPWLLALIAFFVLSKSAFWPSFWNDETAAQYTKRVKWDGQPDEKRRAMLLVKVHPSLLRLVAPEARIWIQSNWARWSKDPPEWLDDRWKRGLPSVVLSQEALKELGGKNRRRSTLAEQLGLVDVASSTLKAIVAAPPIRVPGLLSPPPAPTTP